MGTSLQALGQSLEHWQALYIISLVIGVLATIFIILFSFHVERQRNALRWSNYIYLLAAWLAVVSSIVIIKKTRAIDADKDREVNSRIATATAEAAKSNARAQTASEQIVTCMTEQSKLSNDRLKLQVRLREIEVSEARLSAAAKQSEAEMVVLQESTKPRRLSPQQQNQIANLLRKYSGQKIEIRMHSQDVEAIDFANSIAEILQKAGLVVHVNNVIGAAGRGLWVICHDPEPVTGLPTSVFNAFSGNGVPIGWALRQDLAPNKDQWFILVGSKIPAQ